MRVSVEGTWVSSSWQSPWEPARSRSGWLFASTEFAPRGFGRALFHAGLALAMGWLAVPAAITAVMGAGAGAVVAVFTTAFPALIYMFLAGLWGVKHAQGLLLHR